MTNRRRFIASSAVAAVSAPAIVRGQDLNSKVQLASIGSDGKGWTDTREMSTFEKSYHVAFCDVDLSRTKKVAELRPEAPIFQDYREMLEKLGDQIDAVTVSTPDHMHAYIALDAMRQGKHVYVQKPLTHNVWEARQMRLQAAKSGVMTRMGNQIHSHEAYRTGVHLIQSGAIGKVKRVHSWCAATGHGKSFHLDRPAGDEPAPASVNWDSWIGVAPMRPYGGFKVYHPWGWRDWQDFGNGALGDFGCHILDPVYTALEITEAPTHIEADHTGINDEVWPAQTTVHYTYPGTSRTVDSLSITWYDGGRLPSIKGSHLPATEALPRSGSLFIGEEGSMVMPHISPPRLYPTREFEMLDSQNHYHGWLEGIQSGKQPSDGFDYAGPLTEAVLLGNIAVRYRGRKLEWDAKAFQITNLVEANSWLWRDYREGWEIEPV